jgi:exodeoxyribonuclease V beta subunit
MLNWLVAGDGQSPVQWFDHKLGADAIALAWSKVAEQAPARIAVAALPTAAGTPIDVPRPAAEAIQALDAPRSMLPGWRIGSFSGMLHGALERPAADHDADARSPTPEQVPGDDILGFPRGMDAGTCLHAMLERADFGDRQTWLPAVRAALALYPQSLPGTDARGRLERMALSMIDDVVRTPMPGGFMLQDVDGARRIEELEFHLPSNGLSDAHLSRVLGRFGYAVPTLRFGNLDGYLNGFIDLAFEHAGRYYLLDWKSNHLGTSAASYRKEALEAAMAQHGYHLQYLLYCVALDRHLALRLPAYDRATHFGGVLYLFVRGVRPAWQVDGQPTGVFFHKPQDEVIDALSALLSHEQGVRE